MKERVMAIFIGLVMVFSMFGFALMNIKFPQPAETSIPAVVNRPLTQDEKVFVLKTGRVLIQDWYTQNCSDCLEKNAVLEGFALKFSNYAVLEEVVVENKTDEMLQMIGSGGQIMELGGEINEENVMTSFCDIAILQPKECLLAEV